MTISSKVTRSEKRLSLKSRQLRQSQPTISSSSNDNDNKTSKHQMDETVQFNRQVIRFTNFACSIEHPLNMYSFKRSWSWLVAQVRLFWVLWIMFRLVMLLTLQPCEFAHLRYYLLDWTVFYPQTRRVGIIRGYMSLCIFQLALKRSALFGEQSRRAFDVSLFEFLCRRPSRLSRRASKTAVGDRSRSSLDSQTDGRKGGQQQQVLASSISPVWEAHTKEELPATSLRDRRRRHRAEIQLRDQQHWTSVSEKLRNHFQAIVMELVPIGALVILATCYRIAFTPRLNERTCDVAPNWLRVVGLVEVAFLQSDGLISLIGVLLNCRLVEADIKQQIGRIVDGLRPTLERVVAERFMWTPPQSTAGANLDASNRPPGHIKAVVPYNMDDKLLLQHSSPPVMSPVVPPLLSDTERYHKQEQQEQQQRYRHGQFIQTYGKPPLGSTTSGSHFYDMDRSFSVSSSSLSLAPFAMVPSVVGVERRQEPTTSHKGRATTEDETADLAVTRQVVEAQRKVIQMLSCLDGHKALVGFLGNSLYIWVVSCLTFVPMLAIQRAQSTEGKVAISIYLTISAMAMFTCLRFTTVCASVYHRTNRLTAMIFQTCSGLHSRPVVRRWNKVFMIWYCPNRCAFRVLGSIDLTYVNILKTISFLLSGITLTLNYITE